MCAIGRYKIFFIIYLEGIGGNIFEQGGPAAFPSLADVQTWLKGGEQKSEIRSQWLFPTGTC